MGDEVEPRPGPGVLAVGCFLLLGALFYTAVGFVAGWLLRGAF